jgi:hypothetical protein
MRHMRLLLFCAAAIAVAGSFWMVRSFAPPPAQAQVGGANQNVALLVNFGPSDSAPAAWDGSVDVSAGDIFSMRSLRPRPEEKIEGRKWTMASEWSSVFKYRSWEQEPTRAGVRELHYPSLVIAVSGASASLRFQTRQGEFRVNASDVAPGRTTAYLNGRVTVERVPDSVRMSDESREHDSPAVARGKGSEMWVAWTAYKAGASEVLARRFDGRSWQAAQTLSSKPGDFFRVAATGGRNGQTRVVWSEQVNGNYDLYGRAFNGSRWSPVERLTDAAGSDVNPQLSTDSSGNVWMVWQAMRDGVSSVCARGFDGKAWSAPVRLSAAGDAWFPAVASDANGRTYVAWDTYEKGNFDVVYRAFDGRAWSAQAPIADTPRYEANVSLTCDKEGRVWAAWNESGLRWGKDTGLLVRRPATSLYDGRTVAVAVLENGAWKEPAKDFETSLPAALRGRNDLPVLQADGSGRVWLMFRHRFDLIPGIPITAALHGASWETYAASYDGERWTTPAAVPMSQGRSDQRVAAATGADGAVQLAWAMDNRDYEAMIHRRGDVYTASIPMLNEAPAKTALRAREIPRLTAFEQHANESEDVARIRKYRIQSGGKTYHILRGDVHRHTEISRDGKNDGSLSDCYRYAIDAASLDFLGVSDHNNQGGPDVEYINWMNQQTADAFDLSGRFTPLYGYERSLGYPNGHRNVMFAQRGNPTLPIPREEMSGKAGAKALYAYLKQRRGLSIPHTSATSMGTDWRDNDPEVEPLVEIYQGDRTSSEHEGAPKSATSGDVTSQGGGFRPAGFIWNAWAKGYKLGVQASSDHLSTHISYACTIAEEFSREGLLDAMRRRHSYAATDNIILDYRIEAGPRELIQGDIADVSGRFRLRVRVIGTAPIRQIDIVRSNTYLHTTHMPGKEADFTFIDNNPLAGESYYYVRVQQVDDQMAWSSPIWVRR